MLEQILMWIKNWFVVPNGIHISNYSIENGQLELPFLQNGQYFRIVGSVFNDGLHAYPEASLYDEEFYGAIWALAIPAEIISISEEASAWEAQNAATTAGAYQSESFGGYSYTRAMSKDGTALTWRDVFGKRLNPWRKL